MKKRFETGYEGIIPSEFVEILRARLCLKVCEPFRVVFAFLHEYDFGRRRIQATVLRGDEENTDETHVLYFRHVCFQENDPVLHTCKGSNCVSALHFGWEELSPHFPPHFY